MTGICPANSFSSLAFSSSGVFSRLASGTVIPQCVAFQAETHALRHAVLAAEVRALRPGLMHLQDADDPLCASYRSLHRPPLIGADSGRRSRENPGAWQENRGLRQANGILCKTSAYLAMAELGCRSKGCCRLASPSGNIRRRADLPSPWPPGSVAFPWLDLRWSTGSWRESGSVLRPDEGPAKKRAREEQGEGRCRPGRACGTDPASGGTSFATGPGPWSGREGPPLSSCGSGRPAGPGPSPDGRGRRGFHRPGSPLPARSCCRGGGSVSE